MSQTLENLMHEVDELPRSEQFKFYSSLRSRFEVAEPMDLDEAETADAWEAEIAKRVKDIQSGKVDLISGKEFELRTQALFEQLGINRTPRENLSA